MFRFYSVIIGYFFGCFQTSYFLGKLNKIDIRDYGSKSSGATNANRVLGKKAGIITILCDILKSVLAYLISAWLFKSENDLNIIAGIWAGLGVILGHDFPFFLNFKGGKGIASSMGLILIFNWKFLFSISICGIVAILISHKISVGSIVGAIAFSFFLPVIYTRYPHEIFFIFIAIIILAIWRHNSNIKRLIQKSEPNIF